MKCLGDVALKRNPTRMKADFDLMPLVRVRVSRVRVRVIGFRSSGISF